MMKNGAVKRYPQLDGFAWLPVALLRLPGVERPLV
jgi:hypothetical protein